MSVDQEIERLVENTVRRVLGELFIGDRRGPDRPVKNGAKAKAKAFKYTAPACKVKGCKSPGVNLWGGFCAEHKNSRSARRARAKKK